MKRSWIVVPLWFLAIAAAPVSAQDSTEAELNRLEDLRYEAMKNVDTKTLNNLFAEEFVYQTLQGVTHSKSSYIGTISSGDVKINTFKRENSRVKSTALPNK